MRTSDIRQLFLNYFADHDHTIVASGPLVPEHDPSLLFTNSGMVQFKEVFLGNQSRPYRRAATAQRCVRAGGKHNDLENVGYTARHHTFFEMLGNFSFGDYFKQRAIHLAWELLCEGFGLPRERLWVTVFEQDDEAADIWINQIGVDPGRVTRIGAQDNFWQMGETGPCGPCSEIFYDHGPEVAGGPPGTPEQDGDRYVEIWNLVFMQFNRSADGTLQPLPQPSVDTGMGLERMAAVLQGVHSNYETDLFQQLIAAVARVMRTDDVQAQSLRVIADHIRSTAFLILDGVLPSNEGRGYVLRRIARRAIRHGHQLGCQSAFMHRLVEPLIAQMGDAYPELIRQQAHIERVLQRENEKFNETLDQGLKILHQEIAALQGGDVPGHVVFKLYDTFGFPADMTADVARERGLGTDLAGFEATMKQQRKRARSADRFTRAAAAVEPGAMAGGDTDGLELRPNDRLEQALGGLAATGFIGHTVLDSEVVLSRLLLEYEPVDALSANQDGAQMLVLEQTPFYAESGGQAGDQGTITFRDGALFAVQDTRYLGGRVICHIGRLERGRVKQGDRGRAEVCGDRRRRIACNHSATHLLHAALKTVLGEHVQQKGSLVTADRLRFDFVHFTPLTEPELQAIAHRVNDWIRENHAAQVETMALERARAAGAEALFGEKYDDQVRTIKMGAASFELCGGTHVARSGDIGQFVIVSETGVASGVRRIDALSGAGAQAYVSAQLASLRALSMQLKTVPEQLPDKVHSLVEMQKQQQRQIQTLQAKLAVSAGDADAGAVRQVAGIKVAVLRLDDADVTALRLSVDQWKQKLASGVVVVAGVRHGKVTLLAGVTRDLAARYAAGDLIRTLSPLVGGKGGGKAELAQGGGTNAAGIAAAFARALQWVEEQAAA